MDELRKTGRVTIPTDLDVVPETLEILKKWGADAIRDCDGTDFPQQLKDADAKIYSTYYTTRKDNAWAKANPDEVQQCYGTMYAGLVLVMLPTLILYICVQRQLTQGMTVGGLKG